MAIEGALGCPAEASRLTDGPPMMSGRCDLPWESVLSVTSFGVTVALRCNDAGVLESLRPQLSPLKEQPDALRADAEYSILAAGRRGAENVAVHRLFLGQDEVLSTDNLDVLLDRLISDVHHQVAVHARDALFVHAGVVGWHSAAILLPGRSHSGKSTLVAELVRAGAAYYSDEYAVFDHNGQVHPYPKRVSLRPADKGGQRELRSVESLGGHTGSSPLPVGLIAVVRYEAGATWKEQPLAPGQALLALLDNTLLARSRPEVALDRFGRAVQSGAALAGLRGEAEGTVRYLLSYLDSHAPVAHWSGETLERFPRDEVG